MKNIYKKFGRVVLILCASALMTLTCFAYITLLGLVLNVFGLLNNGSTIAVCVLVGIFGIIRLIVIIQDIICEENKDMEEFEEIEHKIRVKEEEEQIHCVLSEIPIE